MDNQQLIAEIRERHESDDAILLGHIEAECCDAHRESHNDRAELLRIAKELEEQLKAANGHQREWGRLWSDLIKLEEQLAAVRVARYRWKHSLVSDLDSRYWQALNTCGDDIDAAIVGDNDGHN